MKTFFKESHIEPAKFAMFNIKQTSAVTCKNNYIYIYMKITWKKKKSRAKKNQVRYQVLSRARPAFQNMSKGFPDSTGAACDGQSIQQASSNLEWS